MFNEDFSLLWIDDNIQEFANDNYETQQLFRQLLSSVHFESYVGNAISVINHVKYTEKNLIIVVSGQKATLLFETLTYYDLNDDIAALFIFCHNSDAYQTLTHDKLFGIFNDPKLLVDTIRVTMYLIVGDNVKTPTNPLDQLQAWSRSIPQMNTVQIWYQLYLDIFKSLPCDEQAKEEMLQKSQEYYSEQYSELQNINRFRITYTSAAAIRWYTEDSFVHKLVNKALRSEDMEVVSAFRFFIADLSNKINEEYINQKQQHGTIASKFKSSSNSIIKLFSGQVLPLTEVERLEQNVGIVIAVNGFFSTSVKRSTGLIFSERKLSQNHLQRVLVEISLNTSLQNITAFAEINTHTMYYNEEETLFDYGAVFNVTSVKYDSDIDLWDIKLAAVSRNFIEEQPYLSAIRETFIQNHSYAVIYGIIMGHGFGRKNEAIQYFGQLLLNYSSDHVDIPDILEQRGILYEKNNEHTMALHDYNQALEIRRKRVCENLLGMGSLHNHIGILQMTTSDTQTSLNSYQEAMNIYEQIYTRDYDYVTKAKVNESIGLTYLQAGNLSKALEYLTNVQKVYKKVLSDKHPYVIELMGHLGTVYETTNNFSIALKLFYRQLNRSEETLPIDHPQLIKSFDDLIRIQIKMNQTSNISALISRYTQKLMTTSDNHYSFFSYTIAMVASHYESSEPAEAIRLYNEVLKISQKSIKVNVSLISNSHRKLATLNRKIGNLTDALDHASQALKTQQQVSIEQQNKSLEADDLYTIGSIYLEMKLYTDALQYLIKSLTIYQSIHLSNHPSIQSILIDITQAANRSRSSKY
ncbi:unnamed protein product [Adineta steineri]|uniref:Uncharacterized protein n=1 Tax=Adineta steineri TaxID=433720 RepID=A0A818R5Z8_9BILA|nr:unnamed protein product [Adineta steineri]CAF3649504.1 unnamed protein product [Adineta steineri]